MLSSPLRSFSSPFYCLRFSACFCFFGGQYFVTLTPRLSIQRRTFRRSARLFPARSPVSTPPAAAALRGAPVSVCFSFFSPTPWVCPPRSATPTKEPAPLPPAIALVPIPVPVPFPIPVPAAKATAVICPFLAGRLPAVRPVV